VGLLLLQGKGYDIPSSHAQFLVLFFLSLSLPPFTASGPFLAKGPLPPISLKSELMIEWGGASKSLLAQNPHGIETSRA